MSISQRRRLRREVESLRQGRKEIVCITLTEELLAKIDEERGRYGLSRSAFMEWQMREKLGLVGRQY
jgi:hypothetical protein